MRTEKANPTPHIPPQGEARPSAVAAVASPAWSEAQAKAVVAPPVPSVGELLDAAAVCTVERRGTSGFAIFHRHAPDAPFALLKVITGEPGAPGRAADRLEVQDAQTKFCHHALALPGGIESGKAHANLAVSGDALRVAVLDKTRRLYLWSPLSGELLVKQPVNGPPFAPQWFGWLPGGQLLAVGPGVLWSATLTSGWSDVVVKTSKLAIDFAKETFADKGWIAPSHDASTIAVGVDDAIQFVALEPKLRALGPPMKALDALLRGDDYTFPESIYDSVHATYRDNFDPASTPPQEPRGYNVGLVADVGDALESIADAVRAAGGTETTRQAVAITSLAPVLESYELDMAKYRSVIGTFANELSGPLAQVREAVREGEARARRTKDLIRLELQKGLNIPRPAKLAVIDVNGQRSFVNEETQETLGTMHRDNDGHLRFVTPEGEVRLDYGLARYAWSVSPDGRHVIMQAGSIDFQIKDIWTGETLANQHYGENARWLDAGVAAFKMYGESRSFVCAIGTPCTWHAAPIPTNPKVQLSPDRSLLALRFGNTMTLVRVGGADKHGLIFSGQVPDHVIAQTSADATRECSSADMAALALVLPHRCPPSAGMVLGILDLVRTALAEALLLARSSERPNRAQVLELLLGRFKDVSVDTCHEAFRTLWKTKRDDIAELHRLLVTGKVVE